MSQLHLASPSSDARGKRPLASQITAQIARWRTWHWFLIGAMGTLSGLTELNLSLTMPSFTSSRCAGSEDARYRPCRITSLASRQQGHGPVGSDGLFRPSFRRCFLLEEGRERSQSRPGLLSCRRFSRFSFIFAFRMSVRALAPALVYANTSPKNESVQGVEETAKSPARDREGPLVEPQAGSCCSQSRS